ncbi:hypothetical protein AN1V17_06120 [Vallitalea sediminicola]
MSKEYKNSPPNAILRGVQKNRESEQTVIDLFENQVLEKPEGIAIKHNERELSYKQLSLSINKISNFIEGVPKTRNRVGIFVENSIEVIASVMAVLKAKSAYVPLDVRGGAFRNMNILLDSNPDLILISQRYLDNINLDPEWKEVSDLLTHKYRFVVIDDLLAAEQDYMNTSVRRVSMSDLAYIMYTSGSTGKPKGVVVSHYNLINFLLWAKDQYISDIEYNEPLMFALYASLAFDMTAISLFVPLITGNGIVIYDSSNSGYALGKIIHENLVDILILTPSLLLIMEDYNFKESKLKVLVAGGEILKTSLARKISHLFSDKITIYNLYGPTETTIGCMSYKYNPVRDLKNAVPIGGPIDNTDIYILKEDMTPATVNEIGEIYISGINVTDGYINQSELTNKSFLMDLYSNNSRMMYKSNDLAILQDDGTVMFAGRSDYQIKLNGYRIELEEIETFIVNYEGIKDAAVVLINESELDYICAYIVCEKDCSPDTIKKYLSTKLPLYMLPKKYVFLPTLPYTVNGKINRKKLSSTNADIN